MGQVHQGSATTTAAICRAIQNTQESLGALAKRYGINQKTVAKWTKRNSVANLPTGPTSKLAYAELHQKAGKMVAAQFLRNLIAAVPYTIHTVLTDNGIQFANHARHKYAIHHIFDRVCDENGIEHRLTKIIQPWTNGQVERMNRTIKDATVKRFQYDSHDQLRRHLQGFIDAYNFGRKLKTLKGLTPYEFICEQRTSEPDPFTVNPLRQITGLNI